MKTPKKPPKWLNEKDTDEWQWAYEYLQERWPERIELVRFNGWINFENLIRLIHTLENHAEGVKLIGRLQGNLRQRRHRASKSMCSFTLSKQAKSTLKKLARHSRSSEIALFQRLIEEEDQRIKRSKLDTQLEKMASESRLRKSQPDKILLEETNKQLYNCLKQIAMWEVSTGVNLPALSVDEKTEADLLAEQRIREIQEAISTSVGERQKQRNALT